MAAAPARALRRRDGGRLARRRSPAPARLPARLLAPAVRRAQRPARAEQLDDGVALPRDGDLLAPARRRRVAESAVWTYAEPRAGSPDTRGYCSLDFHSMDAWYEEEERIYVHARDPYLRADARRSSRHVVAEVGGVAVAETRRPVLLDETGLITRYYIPLADVRRELLEASATFTECPYKGRAEYWSVRAPGGALHDDAAWCYRAAAGRRRRRRRPPLLLAGARGHRPAHRRRGAPATAWRVRAATASRRCPPGAPAT